MSESDLVQKIEFVAQDRATGEILKIVESLKRLDEQARRTNIALGKALGGKLSAAMERLKVDAKAFTGALSDGATTAASALKADATAADDLRIALAAVVDEMKEMARAAKASGSAVQSNAAASATAARSAASGRARASRDAISDVARIWRIRQRSEAAELAAIARVRRERAALRREASRSAHHVIQHARHAAHKVAPLHEGARTAASTTMLAASFAGGAALEHIVRASETLDTSMTRLRMFAPELNSDEIRKQALGDSIGLGIGADRLVDAIAKSVRDGVPPEIAKTLPKGIASAAQVMGGDVERLTDSLAEGVQESVGMGWVKNAADAHRLLNVEAGLSSFMGNTSEKSEQFIAAGGLGHGREMGLDMTDTLAMGALLNASGARTGQASARFMGQLTQNIPRMFDRYMASTRSVGTSEESRAVVGAPRSLGYGSVSNMQAALMSGPNGLIDFASRLSKLDEKKRKLILEGYGFSEQGGAMLAEIGASPDKAKAILARAKELASQQEANDYLSEKFGEWQKSLANMISQIEAGWRAIESEIGDVIKNDIIEPIRNWWMLLSEGIVNSNLKDKVHEAIKAFLKGLGFDDVKSMLDTLTGGANAVDVAGFLKGVGEGIRAVIDQMKRLADILGTGGLSAETIGRIATEFTGLAVALWLIGPLIGVVSAVASAILAPKAAVEFGGFILRLTNLADGIKALTALDLAGGAAGLAALAGSIAALIGLAGLADQKGILKTPEGLSGRDLLEFLDPRLADLVYGPKKDGTKKDKGNAPRDDSPGAYWDRKRAYLLHRESYSDDDDTADLVRAMLLTGEGVGKVYQTLLDTNEILRTLVSAAANGDGAGASGAGGGNANLRYGRSASGGWNSTPGTGSFGNPSKSLLDFIAQSEGTRGYNTSLGFGKYLPGGKEQNLTGMTLNQILALGDQMRRMPGNPNSSALGRYQITGNTIRDLMKRMHLTGNEKFDEKMQDAMASRLIADEGPRALGRWASLKGDKLVKAEALRRQGLIAPQADPSITSTGGGSAGGAVDIALGMQGAGERQAQQILGKYMHPGEWCADFVNGALEEAGIKGTGSGMADSFSRWGHHVGFNDVQKGDVIEERHGNHVGHAGLATGRVKRDANGNVVAVEMVSGNYGNQVRTNWEKIGMIADLRRSNQAVEQTAKKVIDQTHKSTTETKRKLTTADAGSSAGGVDGSDNAGAHHHFEMHFHHGVKDAEQLAHVVVKKVQDRMYERTHDIEFTG